MNRPVHLVFMSELHAAYGNQDWLDLSCIEQVPTCIAAANYLRKTDLHNYEFCMKLCTLNEIERLKLKTKKTPEDLHDIVVCYYLTRACFEVLRFVSYYRRFSSV